MPYKRNPMRAERIAGLSRYVIVNSLNTDFTSASQWLERTLDDSANRRIAIPEGFLAVDGVLDLCLNVTDGLVVNEKIVEKNLQKELPFMITENILMDKVKEGGNRQELHEEIRKLSLEASSRIKQEGLDNDLFDRLCASKVLNISKEKQKEYLDSKKYVGRAPEQVSEFLSTYVKPILEKNKDLLGIIVVINK
jgi:adenylosuccinate lyase